MYRPRYLGVNENFGIKNDHITWRAKELKVEKGRRSAGSKLVQSSKLA